MVQDLGANPSQILSKFSPFLLIDLKNILENGDDTEANKDVLQNVIEPALTASISRLKLTQPTPGDSGLDTIF